INPKPTTRTGTPTANHVDNFEIRSGLETTCTFVDTARECEVNADCDDSNVCTTDTCSVTGICQHTPAAGGEVGRAAAGSCGVQETVEATTSPWPADAKKTTECRASGGIC